MDLSDSTRLSPLGSTPSDVGALQHLEAAAPRGRGIVQRDTLPVPAGVGPSAPPIHRGSMSATPWRGFWAGMGDMLWQALGRLGGAKAAPAEALEPWQRAAQRRRRTLLLMVLLSAVGATSLLNEVLPVLENEALRMIQIGLFGLLFAWVAAGFFTAMMGFWVQLRGDKFALSVHDVADQPLGADARTAVIMPICNEQVSTVFAGLRATCESLAAAGGSRLVDFYVLSDTSDPHVRAAELAAWAELRTQLGELGGAGRVFYRWRQRRTKRKSGNVADFCRRWGKNYRYMVVLDADSVMSGDGILSMMRLMEANPRAGIIQTAPQACGLSTMHARAQQFAGRVTGRLFTAGMQFWQLGESHYWGHNAIIRVEPFMKHCGLAALPGRGGLSGEILSHDFVEAALMRRAGYHVWLVGDLQGSYEQQPPNVLEELKRDRRWCQGNLQNARLLAEPGLKGVHRTMLLTGAMAYLSAPLWLMFVVMGGALQVFGGAAVFNTDKAVPLEMWGLWACTVAMLALPRVLGVLTIVLKKEQHLYGGGWALSAGAVLEGLLSVLQAPVRMIAHTLFVIIALTGLKLDWKSPPREADDVTWGHATRRFAPVMVLVAAALAGAHLATGTAVWLLPIAVPLLLAVPLTVWASRASVGERLRRRQLLVVPEECVTPTVLSQAWSYADRGVATPAWREVVTNPWLFDVVRAAMGQRNTTWGLRGKARKLLVRRLLLERDAETVNPGDLMRLLSEPQTMVRLRDQLLAENRFAPALAQLKASWSP
jgi:membrane glycosyltransferase